MSDATAAAVIIVGGMFLIGWLAYLANRSR